MFGHPKDVDGECNAHLYIGDDYGDNQATMRCSLPDGHEGHHKECYNAGYHGDINNVVITWEKDTRIRDLVGVAVGDGKETKLHDEY